MISFSAVCADRRTLRAHPGRVKPRNLLGLVTSAVLATTVAFWLVRRGPGPLPAAPREAPPATVRTLVVRTEPLEETLVATGTVRAEESVELRPEISGLLTQIHFQEGTLIQAGKILVSLNDAELRANLQRAVYRRELAELKTHRLDHLRDQGGVTQQEYDIAASELNVLNAEVAVIEAQLAHTKILAPFDGIIGLRSVSVGAYVTPATRIATFQRLDRLKVDFSIPEKYADRLDPTHAVSVQLAGPGPALAGTIAAIEPLIDPSTRTAQIRAICANPGGRLLPGGLATVRLTLARTPDALLVPAMALVPGAQEQTVFVVRDGKVQRRSVQTRARTDTSVQVVSGLKAGEMIVVSGQGQLRPGQSVKPEAALPAGGSSATAAAN